jgi:hypothetical protein
MKEALGRDRKFSLIVEPFVTLTVTLGPRLPEQASPHFCEIWRSRMRLGPVAKATMLLAAALALTAAALAWVATWPDRGLREIGLVTVLLAFVLSSMWAATRWLNRHLNRDQRPGSSTDRLN